MRPSRRLAFLAAGVFFAAMGCTDDTATPSEPDAGRCDSDPQLVLSYDDLTAQSGIRTVARVNPTTGAREDVKSDWVAGQAAVHPDGHRIAVTRADGYYESAGPDSEQIWAVDLDGNDPRQVSTGPWDTQPAWSPTGDRIVYIADETEVAVVDADGEEAEVLVEVGDGMRVSNPAWSPDGNSVAYVVLPDRGLSGQTAIQVVDVDTRATRELLRANGTEEYGSLSWLHDPNLIAVGQHHPSTETFDLIAVSPGGAGATSLHDGVFELRQSSRGDLFAFGTAVTDPPFRFHPARFENGRLALGEPLPVDARGASGHFDVTNCR